MTLIKARLRPAAASHRYSTLAVAAG